MPEVYPNLVHVLEEEKFLAATLEEAGSGYLSFPNT